MYYGQQCLACPNCTQFGTCVDTTSGDGTCECQQGYQGATCSDLSPVSLANPSGETAAGVQVRVQGNFLDKATSVVLKAQGFMAGSQWTCAIVSATTDLLDCALPELPRHGSYTLTLYVDPKKQFVATRPLLSLFYTVFKQFPMGQ